MICNSGLLITRKLKELMSGGDMAPSRRPPPTKAVLPPISAEPTRLPAPPYEPRSSSPPEDFFKSSVEILDSWDTFESPAVVCASLDSTRPSGCASLNRPSKPRAEFTKINGKTVRLYSSLPRHKPKGLFTPQLPTTHRQHPSRDPPARPPLEMGVASRRDDSGNANYVALSDIYAELPRKKKKPCMVDDCSSVHHHSESEPHPTPRAAHAPATATVSKSSSTKSIAKKFNTLDFSRKKHERLTVFQKFSSLDRGWRSFVTSRKSNSSSSSKASPSEPPPEQEEPQAPILSVWREAEDNKKSSPSTRTKAEETKAGVPQEGDHRSGTRDEPNECPYQCHTLPKARE
ncbi:hypothetical protein E2C01_048969 [Portunus trituberculatus]|uniref:Uncharacterized protein n=1 Tax=Portunus trituberculatus TaxID=210409 RepID=A0A5B7GCY7_PORTR|nr:hypothetical protein [Portunus trituberculatus]